MKIKNGCEALRREFAHEGTIDKQLRRYFCAQFVVYSGLLELHFNDA